MKYIESGMDFTPLFESDKSQIFYIEQSDLYKRMKSNGVKSVEFVMSKGRKIYFIECKPSFPNISNPDKEEEINLRCQELYDKLHHSLDLLLAKQVGVPKHQAQKFPAELGNIEALSTQLADNKIFFLVIMGQNEKTGEWFEEDWCEAIRVLLNEKLTPLRKIWDIEVLVIDSEQARKRQMIA